MAIRYRSRIHPLMAAAAVSTTLVSVMGIAAISGVLPWIPGAALQKLPSASPRPGVAAVPTAIVVPTASLKATAPLTAAESLAPGETLIAGDTPAMPRAVSVTPAVPAAPIATVSTPTQPTVANAKVPAAPLTVAKTMTPNTPQPASTVRPEIATTPRTLVAVSPARAAPQAGQRPTEPINIASMQSTRSARERQREREAALLTSSGYSTGGSTGTGAGLRSRNSTTQSNLSNDRQLYSDFRRTPKSTTAPVSNVAPKITPIYRADAPVDSVPPVDYQDQQFQPSQRAGNRTVGEVAVFSERSRAEPNRRYRSSDREAAPAAYPVASTYGGDTGSGSTVGTAIGRTVSKGIDKTISVISDVLNGRYVPPPADPQDSIYR